MAPAGRDIDRSVDDAALRGRAEDGRRAAEVRGRVVVEDEDARVRRIEAAAPPAATFEGQLHRFRESRREETEFETVWNGTKGREGLSLTSGGGSSLAPGPLSRMTI